MLYNISPASEWFEISEFLDYCNANSVDLLPRLFLASDGSMTNMLQTLLMNNITMDVQRQEKVQLGHEEAEFLNSDVNAQAIVRDAWLMSSSKRLVYACSVLPLSQMNDKIYEEITESKNPLGTLILKQNMPTLRDCLKIGLVRSEDVAKELGLPKDCVFWARKYRLTGESGLKAAILEIFSPYVFSP